MLGRQLAIAMLVACATCLAACTLLFPLDGYDGSSTDGGSVDTGPYTGLPCGDAACDPLGELCCFANGIGDSFPTASCGPASDTCIGADYAQCRTSDDCAHTRDPSSVCCYVMTHNVQGDHTHVECMPSDECIPNCDAGTCQRTCDTTTSPCPGGAACNASPIRGVSTCLQ